MLTSGLKKGRTKNMYLYLLVPTRNSAKGQKIIQRGTCGWRRWQLEAEMGGDFSLHFLF